MLKKIVTLFLSVMILTVASSASLFARSNDGANENQTAVKRENKTEKADLKSLIKAQEKTGGLKISNKSTLAEYQRQKRQGKGMSTTTKVLIGVGITVAVVAIVAIAARNSVRDNIFR